MIRTIVFHIGSSQSHYLVVALSRLKHQLQQRAVHYLNRFKKLNIHHTYASFGFFFLLRRSEYPDLRFLQEETNSRSLLIFNNATYLYPETLFQAKIYLSHIFPDAKMHVSLSLSRQDRDIDALSHLSLLYENSTPQIWCKRYLQSLPDIPLRLDELRAVFGKDAVTVTVAEDTPQGRREVLGSLLRKTAPGVDALASGVSDAELAPLEASLPREFLCFSAACNTYFPPEPTLEVMPWSTQMRRFSPESGFSGDWRPLLSPKLRAKFLSHYADSNAALARALGRERLFPDPEPDPDWEPFAGLNPDTAFAVASRLEPDFARARMRELDSLAPHFLDHDARVCREALHDACEPAPARVFFPSPGAAEPKVSVLTLCYNHAAFLAENIESVLAQRTDFPFQHIIADDDSDDGSREIILDYAAKHPHIVPVFQRKRSRGPKNVRALFGMARTPYVALCDGDDYFSDPEKLQRQADFLDAHPDCGLCFHPVRVVYEDDPERERVYPPLEELPRGIRPFYYLSDLIRCNLIQTNSVMYRWRFTKGLPDWFRHELLPGDWYWHLLHAERGKIGFINRIMSVYRRHSASVYYLAEVDRLKHRFRVGKKELQMYEAVNEHFEGRFLPILLDLTNGVFADCLLHAQQIDDFSIIEELTEQYPEFGRHFLRSLKLYSAKA